jgi:transglutaminase-like putative cysteine protease
MARPDPAPPLDAAPRAWTLLAALVLLASLLVQLPPALAALFGAVALGVAALSWRRPLPAPVRLLLVVAMLAAIAWQMGGMRFGRDTGCALLAAMLAIKSSELRGLRDGRSLLGFALFAPFAAFLLDQGPATMALALAGVVLALLALQRLADVEDHAVPPPLRRQLGGIGRLALLGLPLMLAAFWLFPRLATPLWGVPERALARPGLSDTMDPGAWVDLMADDTPAFRVRFDGQVPAPAQRYWRGPVLWDFDGRRWTRPSWFDGGRAPAPAATAPPRWRYQLDYEPTDRRLLVALDLPLQAPPGARLAADHTLTSERPLAALTRWTLASAPAPATPAALSPGERRRALALPPGYNPRTVALARQWRAEAGSAGDAALVRRAMDWIHRDFSYTLETPLPGHDGVDEFLFRYRAGFCEHFSSAFVVLMRAAGVPARVVTGFAGGVRNRFGDYWVVRRMDAHAWAEVWLPGQGWTRVDPTAAVAPERVSDTLENRLGGGGGEGQTSGLADWSTLAQAGDWLRRGWNDLVLSFDAGRQQALLRPLGIDRLDPARLVALFAASAGGALALMAWWLARGERERDPLLRAWHRLGRRYARRGLGREPSEPAGCWAARVERLHPGSGLPALSDRFAVARYARGQDSASLATLIHDLHTHRPPNGASP